MLLSLALLSLFKPRVFLIVIFIFAISRRFAVSLVSVAVVSMEIIAKQRQKWFVVNRENTRLAAAYSHFSSILYTLSTNIASVSSYLSRCFRSVYAYFCHFTRCGSQPNVFSMWKRRLMERVLLRPHWLLRNRELRLRFLMQYFITLWLLDS